MTNVAVGIPWRPTPERQQAVDYVVAWYERHLPDARLELVDTGHATFNRAAARNACVRHAQTYGADVVVINDADTVPALDALEQAIREAHDGRLHFGLDRMLYLTEYETDELYAGQWPNTLEAKPHDSSVLVCTPAAWWYAGGQDERFDGWGGEDGAFCSAATALIGVSWHRGDAISLHHGDACRDVGSDRWRPNSDLAMRYFGAATNPEAVRALIAERTA